MGGPSWAGVIVPKSVSREVAGCWSVLCDLHFGGSFYDPEYLAPRSSS